MSGDMRKFINLVESATHHAEYDEEYKYAEQVVKWQLEHPNYNKNPDGSFSIWYDSTEFSADTPEELVQELFSYMRNPSRFYDRLGEDELNEKKCWKGYTANGTKKSPTGKRTKSGKIKRVPNCVKTESINISTVSEGCDEDEITLDEDADVYGVWFEDEELEEAEYQGKKVKLNKPVRSSNGPKKFHVYVKNKKGNVVKVNFGDPKMKIKKSNPERRKSFRARHKCDQKKDKTTAGYWSCRAW